MSSFKSHLKEKLKNQEFKTEYEQQRELSDLALRIQTQRQKEGLTQKELAKMAGITQQQLSKIEHAVNGNILTYLKVLNALNYSLTLKPKKELVNT